MLLPNTYKKIARLGFLPVLLLSLMWGAVHAAPTASFSATASGTPTNMSLNISANIADADVMAHGSYYVGYLLNNSWSFLTEAGWQNWNTGPVPAYASGPLVSTSGVWSNINASNLVGAQVYVGYGRTEADMINNEKYAHVYTFTTAEVVKKGPAPVLLGTSANFAVLAKTGISTVPPSVITGDVGVSPAATSFLTGFSLTMVGTTAATSPQVTGFLYGADMTVPASSNLTTAVLNMQTAYTDAAGRPTPDVLNLGGGNIGGQTLVGGLYTFGSSVTMPSDIALTGGVNDVWIFQISGDLVISANTQVIMEGSVNPNNIFWQVAGEVRIGAGARVVGNILSQTAIIMQTGSQLHGRALAQTMVTLDAAVVTRP